MQKVPAGQVPPRKHGISRDGESSLGRVYPKVAAPWPSRVGGERDVRGRKHQSSLDGFDLIIALGCK
jgi:hypothetical protein